ncbi:MAG: hypothetical protein Q7U36_00195 [bacterium]|nr:hypothetical protein [bacterium]
MILTTHALVGTAIGKNIENPWLVILLSLVVHFFLDSFRHGEYFDSRVATIKDTVWKILLDLFIPVSIILFFIFSAQPTLSSTRNILLGAFFSILPDFFTVLFWTFDWKILKRIKKFHSFCHHYSRFPKFSPERQWNLRNAMNDILFSAIAIIILFL